MRHSIEWQDDADNAAPEERATVADLRLWLNGIKITQHLLEGTVSDHITVALYGLAHGIAHDWWTIFGSRNCDVSLLKFRNGYVLPDVRMRFDGAAFEIEALQHTYRNPDVRFWGGTSEVLSRETGEAVLTGFVQSVLTRLSDSGVGTTGAALRWKRVQASRNSTEAAFCEAAGGLGLDPYDIDDAAATFIEEAQRLFEGEALIEFVSGAARVRQPELIDWVKNVRQDRGSRYRVANLRSVVDETVVNVPVKAGEVAWATGYRRARGMRNILGLPQHHRFSSFQDIAGKLGAASGYKLAPKVDGIRALRSEGPSGMQIHLRSHGTSAEAQAAHLFAMARAVGDAACFPETTIAPINDLHNAVRQAAGRAFAAEFLAPVDEIKAMVADKHDLITIADEFSVSTAVVERQLENENRIAHACG